MFWIKRWVKDAFVLSHSQANGFVILVPLLAIIVFSGPVWHWYVSGRTIDLSKDKVMLDSLVAVWERQPPEAENQSKDADAHSPFSFNPNHATAEEFRALGFSTALATRIDRYRRKGGKFQVKADLLKIYGIDSAFFRKLYSFIDLPERIELEKKEYRKKEYEKKNSIPLENPLSKFDLNEADTLQFMKIDGIGAKRSQRIVKYRDALGGFVSTDQLVEVFGLDSTTLNRLMSITFVAENFQPKKIHINTSDENTLALHPYFRKSVARSIVAYRFQHGEFKTLGDLRNIHALDEKTIRKITPYLTMGD
jgi:competence protein ComEA